MTDRTTKVNLVIAYTSYVQGLKAAENATKEMAQNSTKAIQQQSQAFQTVSRTVGAALVTMGTVAAAGVALAVKAFMDFSAEMAQVQALSHATADEMAKLTDAAQIVGQKFGYSATQVAQAETELIKAGLSVKDILGGALSGALTIAADGQMDVADATTIAAEAMTQFQLKGKDVPHIADLLAAGADKALGSVGDLGSALESGGLVAHQFGLSLDDTVGTLAAFAQAGLIGERGGTDLRQMLIKLADPSSQAADIMKQLGINLYDASGHFVGITDLAGQLQTKMSGLSEAQRNAALSTIFGSRAIAGANVLYQNGAAGIQDWINKVNDQGFAAEQASKKLDSLAGDLQKLQAAFQTDLIKSGSGANDALRSIVQGVTAALNAFGSLPPVVQQGALYLTALVAVVGLLGGAFVLAVPKVVEFQAAMETLAGSSTRVASALGLVKAATSTLGTALKLTPYVAVAAGAGAMAAGWLNAGLQAAGLQQSVESLTKSLAKAQSQGAAQKTIAPQINTSTFNTNQLSQITNSGWASGLVKGIYDANAALDKFNPVLTFLGNGTANLTDRLSTLDASMAKLVKDGNTRQAAADWAYLQSQTDGSKEALDNLTKLFPEYTKAVKNAKPATDDQTSASAATAAAFKDAADKVQSLDNELKNLIDTLNSTNKSNQDAITANAAYQDALSSVNDTIKKAKEGQDGYSTSLDQNTKAGADNVAMFADMAQKAQNAADAQFAVDGNTQNYVSTLQTQKQALIDTITNLTGNAQAAKDLADQVFAIPDQRTIDIQSTAIQIKANVDALNDALKALPHDQYVDIWQTTHILSQVDASREQAQHQATGGLISGPGSGTSDSIPAWLSNGEYVVRAAATAQNRAVLDYINRGGIARFAQGGFVDARHVQRFASGGPVSAAPVVTLQPQFTVTVASKNGIDLSKYIDVKIQQNDDARARAARAGF